MMAGDPKRPIAWANTLVTAWGPHFPVDVRQIALEYSRRFVDRISKIAEADVDSFEGALYPLEKTGCWAILYNPTIDSAGRINFTLAHEFGHYLNHRHRVSRQGFECTQQRILGYDRNAERLVLEKEADQFASYLLMPMDDFRQQTRGRTMTFKLLNECAERYKVSLSAAALKWLEFTDERAALVVSRDGFVLWSRSSEAAFKSRVFYRSGTELPPESLAAQQIETENGMELAPGVWRHNEPATEMCIYSDRYDLGISLLLFGKDAPWRGPWMGHDETEELFDRAKR